MKSTRRGLLAGAAGLMAVLLGRRAHRSRRTTASASGGLDTSAVDGKPRRADGRIPWIGHY